MNATQQEMEATLATFGWTAGPVFWQRYHSDSWVYNLANALYRATGEVRRLTAELEAAKR